MSRYEALEPPKNPDSTNLTTLEPWRDALKASYISHEYLVSRGKHLRDLEKNGKEEWLAGNEELVDILRGLEEELVRTKESIDHIVVERQRSQQSVQGELMILEEGWKKGVSRTLETEVAADELRRQILDSMKHSA